MIKLAFVTSLLVLATVSVMGCAESEDDPRMGNNNGWTTINNNDSQCPACNQAECPTLECDGKECPTCPACNQVDCPTCDTASLQSEINRLTRNLDDLEEENESCNGNLDKCNKDLAKNLTKNLKSGSRLRLYNYVSDDGAQWPQITPFDTKKNVFCTLTNFSKWIRYGCPDQMYCVTTSKYQSFTDYTSKDLINSSYYNNSYYLTLSYYCDDAYNDPSYDKTILTYFGNNVISNATIRHIENDLYYTDESCTNRVNSPIITDPNCSYSMNSVFSEYVAVSTNEHEVQKVCIDNSILTTTTSTTKYEYKYYKPKESKFYNTLYESYSVGGSCNTKSQYKNGIFLEEVPNLNSVVIAEARGNRYEFCNLMCNAIKKEAVEEDWVKIYTAVAE